MIKLIELIIALLLSLLAGQETRIQPVPELPSDITTDRPSFEQRPAQPVYGTPLPVEELGDPVIVPCTTDLDCITNNPHITEDPDCEWVDGECLTFEQRVARQAEPDWSSGGETVCELEPDACSTTP